MSFYVVNNEYDIDLAVKECTKLMSLDRSRVRLAFNNMQMVHIFMNDLSDKCDILQLDPEDNDFHMDVLVGDMPEDDSNEELNET